MSHTVFRVLCCHEIIGRNNEALLRVVHARVLLRVHEPFPQVIKQPSLLGIDTLGDIVLPFGEQTSQVIADIAFFGDKVHVQREYVLTLKEINHSLNAWLALQELLRNGKHLVFNFFVVNPAHRVVQVVILVEEFEWEPDRET